MESPNKERRPSPPSSEFVKILDPDFHEDLEYIPLCLLWYPLLFIPPLYPIFYLYEFIFLLFQLIQKFVYGHLDETNVFRGRG